MKLGTVRALSLPLAIVMGSLLLAATLIAQGTGPAQPKGPAISLSRTLHDCWGFSETKIHPNRYVLTSMKDYVSPPQVYDIYADTFIPFPKIDAMPGLPAAPERPKGKDSQYKKSEMILKGDYWYWQHKEVVYFDQEKGKAGIVMEKEEIAVTKGVPPSCSLCKGPTALVPQYSRYLCNSCKQYVKESDYTAERETNYYAVVDTAAWRVTALHELKHEGYNADDQTGINPIGIDPSGTKFYYSNNIYFYKNEKSSGHLLLYRLDIPSGQVDLTMEVPVTVREKGNAPLTYSMHSMASADFRKIVFWEYDEASGIGSGKGFLSNPPAQVYVLDTASRDYFAAECPVTAYGQMVDRENKYLLLGSNQTGYIHRYNLALKKEEGKFKAGTTMYKMILSSGSKYLYVFNKKSVEVRSWPSMNALSTIPLSKIVPGVTVLLVSETVHATDDGKYAVFGLLKKAPNGPWWSSDKQDGFHLLSLGD